MLPGGRESRFSSSVRPASASNSHASNPFRCCGCGRRNAVAAGDDFQITVTECESVGIVQNLHIVFVTLGKIDWILMFSNGDDPDGTETDPMPRGGDIHGRMTENDNRRRLWIVTRRL